MNKQTEKKKGVNLELVVALWERKRSKTAVEFAENLLLDRLKDGRLTDNGVRSLNPELADVLISRMKESDESRLGESTS